MNIDLPLNSVMQQKLSQFAALTGKSVDELILEAVEDKLADANVEESTVSTFAPNWIDELRAWSNSHSAVTHFVDDSRESIYEGRGS